MVRTYVIRGHLNPNGETWVQNLEVHCISPPMSNYSSFQVLAREEKLASNHGEFQKLMTENKRLAETQAVTLKEQLMDSDIVTKKAEEEHLVRRLVEQISRMEEFQCVKTVELELQRKRIKAQCLLRAKRELFLQPEELNQDLQSPVVNCLYLRCRDPRIYRRDRYDRDTTLCNAYEEGLKVMENDYLKVSMEIEKLRAMLASSAATPRSRRQDYAGSSVVNENEASGKKISF